MTKLARVVGLWVTCMTSMSVAASAEKNNYWSVLESAIARYAQHESDFSNIIEQFEANPRLIGLGISSIASGATEVCIDNGANEVCQLTYDATLYEMYSEMGVSQIRRYETHFSFDAEAVEIGDSRVYVQFFYSEEDEPIALPCDDPQELTEIDGCAYDLGENWWIELGWAPRSFNVDL